jgi:hypothetical protein
VVRPTSTGGAVQGVVRQDPLVQRKLSPPVVQAKPVVVKGKKTKSKRKKGRRDVDSPPMWSSDEGMMSGGMFSDGDSTSCGGGGMDTS